MLRHFSLGIHARALSRRVETSLTPWPQRPIRSIWIHLPRRVSGSEKVDGARLMAGSDWRLSMTPALPAALPPRGCCAHADRRTSCWPADAAFFGCLTFELSGRQRHDARPRPQTMYTVPVAGAWWHAVGAPLERGVRRQCVRGHTRSGGEVHAPKVLKSVGGEGHVAPDSGLIDFCFLLDADATTKAPGSRFA